MRTTSLWKTIAVGAVASLFIYGVSAVLTSQIHWVVALLFLALLDIVFALVSGSFAAGMASGTVKLQEVHAMQLVGAIIGIPILLSMFSVGWLLFQFLLALKGML